MVAASLISSQLLSAKNLLADGGMSSDGRHFIVGEPAGLQQNAIRDRNFADIVKRGCEIYLATKPRAQPQFFRDQTTVSRNA